VGLERIVENVLKFANPLHLLHPTYRFGFFLLELELARARRSLQGPPAGHLSYMVMLRPHETHLCGPLAPAAVFESRVSKLAC